MKTNEIANANNKAILQKIVAEIKELPIISKHFQDAFRLTQNEIFNEPIVEISREQKEKINNLIN